MFVKKNQCSTENSAGQDASLIYAYTTYHKNSASHSEGWGKSIPNRVSKILKVIWELFFVPYNVYNVYNNIMCIMCWSCYAAPLLIIFVRNEYSNITGPPLYSDHSTLSLVMSHISYGALWLSSLELLKHALLKEDWMIKTFYCTSGASTWTFLNCADEGQKQDRCSWKPISYNSKDVHPYLPFLGTPSSQEICTCVVLS